MNVLRPDVERVLDIDNNLGETPVWSVAEQALYWVNCEHEPELLRWSPATGDVKRWAMPERIGGVVLKRDGTLLVVLSRGLYDFDPATGEMALRIATPLGEGVSLHESGVDPTGRLWVGAINEAISPDNPAPGGGKLFHLDGDRLVPVIDPISCANGLAFAPDGKALYFSDTLTLRLDKWDLDPATGALSNCRTLAHSSLETGVFDGATVDAEGGYWATLVFAGKLCRYLPDGTPDLLVELPFMNPTKMAFGGPELDTLYITTMGEGGTPGWDGGLYAWKPGFKGLAEVLVG